MPYLNNIIKIKKADYGLITAAYPNSATISTGATVTYNPNAVYLVEAEVITKKYLHNIQITYSNTYIATFSFVNSRSSSYGSGSTTNWSTLVADLNTAGFTSSSNSCPAQGQFSATGKTNLVTGVYYIASNVMGFVGVTLASTSSNTMTIYQNPSTTTGNLGASANIYDVVTEL